MPKPNVLVGKLRNVANHVYAGFTRLYSSLRGFPYPILISLIALAVSIYSTRYSVFGLKAAQRAYLTYDVTVTNAATVLDSVAKDKDFFMYFQIKVTNMGNTPAQFINPKIRVIPDPDRPPLMMTFAATQFDLGPKESRSLPGQVMFKHMNNVRKIPGFSTGFEGQLEYKDVFGDSGERAVCYQLVFESSLNGGFCGSVLQQWQITERGVQGNP